MMSTRLLQAQLSHIRHLPCGVRRQATLAVGGALAAAVVTVDTRKLVNVGDVQRSIILLLFGRDNNV